MVPPEGRVYVDHGALLAARPSGPRLQGAVCVAMSGPRPTVLTKPASR